MKKISVLVPTYNEEANVVPLSEAIIAQFESALPDYDYEIVFIDNCSADSTRDKLRALCACNARIKAILNARNFGQFNSPYYGLQQTTGDCTVLMCADFQDPVEMIPEYVREWENGSMVVLGQKSASKENALVYAFRKLYYRIMRKRSSVEFISQVTGSGLYDRSFVDVLRSMDDPTPFLRGVVAEYGFKVKTVPFVQPKRRAGKSSNSFSRYYDAAMQSFTTYTKFGIRIAVALGVVFTLTSLITVAGAVIWKLLNWATFSLSSIALQLCIFVVVSLQLLFIGLVGEYVLNINSKIRRRPLVVEEERINFEK
jgi:polyisoprenyl-phosphate glycosyltransferase